MFRVLLATVALSCVYSLAGGAELARPCAEISLRVRLLDRLRTLEDDAFYGTGRADCAALRAELRLIRLQLADLEAACIRDRGPYSVGSPYAFPGEMGADVEYRGVPRYVPPPRYDRDCPTCPSRVVPAPIPGGARSRPVYDAPSRLSPLRPIRY